MSGQQDEDIGERALDMIWDEVRMRLNPSGEECPTCGGDGVVFECFDGFCLDAEVGCEDCTSDCAECRRFRRRLDAEVWAEVIEADSIPIAKAWLKSVNRWRDDITDDQIKAELAKEKLNVERDPAARAAAPGAEGSPLSGGAGTPEGGSGGRGAEAGETDNGSAPGDGRQDQAETAQKEEG
jgi:hypothetical protein